MKYFVLLICSLIAFLLLEKQLEIYGHGYGIFYPNLPYKFNTDNESYDGFNIEESGFINIIEKGMWLKDDQNNEFQIKHVKSYSTYNQKLFVLTDTQKGEKIVQIILDQKRPMGNKIEYEFFDPERFTKRKDFEWINVTSSKSILRLSFYFVQILIAYLICSKVIKINRLKN